MPEGDVSLNSRSPRKAWDAFTYTTTCSRLWTSEADDDHRARPFNLHGNRQSCSRPFWSARTTAWNLPKSTLAPSVWRRLHLRYQNRTCRCDSNRHRSSPMMNRRHPLSWLCGPRCAAHLSIRDPGWLRSIKAATPDTSGHAQLVPCPMQNRRHRQGEQPL